VGITDVHKIRMFPLSLTGAAFNWFTSLPLNLIDSWARLEQKFHDYLYNGEVELRLFDLTSLRQKYTKTVSDYLKWFREVRNRCYNLTIAEKYLADLAFADLTLYLRDKLDEQEFSDTNQLLQQALSYENHAKSS
jgi:DNA repair ATPase RecN